MFLCKNCNHPDFWHTHELNSFRENGRCDSCGCSEFVADTLEYLEAEYNKNWPKHIE
jgi:hypothetical protein